MPYAPGTPETPDTPRSKGANCFARSVPSFARVRSAIKIFYILITVIQKTVRT